MSGLINIIFGVLIVALVASGFFNLITWSFNWLAILIVVLVWLGVMYNSLVSLVNRTKEAWADIDVQLKRRYDLIPNLVSTVKGYATHEQSTFDQVTKARAEALNAQTVTDHNQADNMLSGALKSLFAVAEAYPDLKANQNFLELQRELADTENKIQAARRFYNGNVRDLNTQIESVPTNFIASMFKFKAMDLFDLNEGSNEREPVKVQI